MICPSCSTLNATDHKFCHECGQPLRPAAASSTGAGGSSAPAAAAVRVDEAAQAARLLEQAYEQYDQGRYDEATGCCQAALALDPGLATAHSLLGMLYERAGKTEEAVQEYQRVLQMNPDSFADAAKLESLLGGRAAPDRRKVGPLESWARRVPVAAGAAAAAVVLVGGLWLVSRVASQSSGSARRVASRAARGPEPGASMPRSHAPAMGMPGAEESLPAPGGTSASLHPQSSRRAGAGSAAQPREPLPAPPPTGAWPALRGAYPPAPALARSPQHRYGAPVPGASLPVARRADVRHGGSGYLSPAPIQGVEKINPGEPAPMAAVPGASLPGSPGAAATATALPWTAGARGGAPEPGRSPRAGAPQLPAVGRAGEQHFPPGVVPPGLPSTTVRVVPPSGVNPAPPAPTPPPSASISIQPLDDSEPRDQARGARQSATPQSSAVTLGDALQHQQMAAYYRRQGDPQAAYQEYQYARDLFRMVQQRGGREAAIAAQGAAAAQYGMSRLQGP